MKIITCASYYGTGSSAVTDLLSEFSNIESMGSSFECRFIQDPHGVSDLEYYLVENNHRHNSGYAIKMFKKLLRRYCGNQFERLENYNGYFGDKFKTASEEYINQLVNEVYTGGWHYDLYDKSNLEILLLKIGTRIYNKFQKSIITNFIDDSYRKRKNNLIERKLAKEKTYVTNPGEDFYEITKKYIEDVFFDCLKDKRNFLMVDQLIPPSNTKRYLRYFNDLKVICVDRDPRDIYILEKVYWNIGVIPTDVDQFIKWFEVTRAHRDVEQDDPNRVLRINFEDLIYDYDQTVSKIMIFLGINSANHTLYKQCFNPELSIKNTKKWLEHIELKEDILKIEQKLNRYLYTK